MTESQPSLGNFLARVAHADERGLKEVYGVEKAALTGASGLTGGYVVPASLSYELMRLVGEQSVVRPRAITVPMTTETVLCPLPDVTTRQSSGVAPYFGGITLSWLPDAAARGQTEPTWRLVELHARDLAGYSLASNTLLADSEMEAYLRQVVVGAIAWYEDQAFLVGDGVGKPLGMYKSSAAISVTRSSSSHLTHTDVRGMVTKLLPHSWRNAIWVMHPSVITDLIDLASSLTTVWQANQFKGRANESVGWLHGLPVYTHSALPALGTAGDVMLIDPSLYVIGDRQVEIAISADEPTAFLRNQSAIRILARVDGRPMLDNSVRLSDASTTVSPYVYLT